MHPRRFALIGGIIMLAMGILAYFPGLNTDTATAGLPPLKLISSYGSFLNTFPMNVVNKLVLILFGVAGIASSMMENRSLPASINWSRWVLFVIAPLAILGIIPATNTLFGYAPLFSGEVWAHGIFAALGAYFGFVLPTQARRNDEWLLRDQDRSKVA